MQTRICILEAALLRVCVELYLRLLITCRMQIGMCSVHLIHLFKHH